MGLSGALQNTADLQGWHPCPGDVSIWRSDVMGENKRREYGEPVQELCRPYSHRVSRSWTPTLAFIKGSRQKG